MFSPWYKASLTWSREWFRTMRIRACLAPSEIARKCDIYLMNPLPRILCPMPFFMACLFSSAIPCNGRCLSFCGCTSDIFAGWHTRYKFTWSIKNPSITPREFSWCWSHQPPGIKAVLQTAGEEIIHRGGGLVDGTTTCSGSTNGSAPWRCEAGRGRAGVTAANLDETSLQCLWSLSFVFACNGT